MLAAALTSCAEIRPYLTPSEGHIAAQPVQKEPDQAIPPPARVTPFVPPPKPTVPVQTYSVVVNEVPVKELLLALARDTKQNIDIHPTLSGIVSLNAINETLPAILERISKQVNLRYRTEGNTIIVSPDTPYIKTYVISYVNIQRNTTSSTGASGQIAVTSGSQSGGGGGSASGGGNSSSTVVTTTSSSDFWKILEQSVRAILNSSLQQALSAEAKLDRLQIMKQEQELRAKQLEAASRAGQAAPALASSMSAPGTGGGQPMTLLADDVIVNSVAGTITVNGNDKQHQLVQEYLTKVETGAQRQVLIEATIVEVSLSDGYQAGIDWNKIAIGGGFAFTQLLLGGFTAAATAAGATLGNAFIASYQNAPGSSQNVNLTLKLLQEFGNARVLSSPKLMVLNNQTALLKAVDNLVYFEVQAQAGVATAGGVVTPPTFNTLAKTVALGVVMGVTPQVSEDGRVLLTVRPTVTRLFPQTPFVQDPNPSLVTAAGATIPNLVPQVQVREMESVLQVGSGQTVILGGLMQDAVQRNREQIPGADKIDPIGEIFRFRNERSTKTELVIFLRPTVVTNPTLEADELKFFQRFLPQPDGPPQAPTPPRPSAGR